MTTKLLLILFNNQNQFQEVDKRMYLQATRLEPKQITYFNPRFSNLNQINLDSYTHIIMGGSVYRLSQNTDHDFILPLQQILKQAFIKNIPYLGICFGMQFMAYTLGAKIQAHNSEHGFIHQEIEMTNPNDNDKFFNFLPPKFKVNLIHQDAVYNLPEKLVGLATSHYIPNQIIRHRELPIFGVQFHPEFTVEKAKSTYSKLPISKTDQQAWLNNITEHRDDEVSQIIPRFLEL